MNFAKTFFFFITCVFPEFALALKSGCYLIRLHSKLMPRPRKYSTLVEVVYKELCRRVSWLYAECCSMIQAFPE